MSLVVVSKVKAAAKAVELRTSSEFTEALSGKVKEVLIQAAKNCRADKRQTLKARDLDNVEIIQAES